MSDSNKRLSGGPIVSPQRQKKKSLVREFPLCRAEDFSRKCTYTAPAQVLQVRGLARARILKGVALALRIYMDGFLIVYIFPRLRLWRPTTLRDQAELAVIWRE